MVIQFYIPAFEYVLVFLHELVGLLDERGRVEIGLYQRNHMIQKRLHVRVQVCDAVAHQHADAVVIIHPFGTAGNRSWCLHFLLL